MKTILVPTDFSKNAENALFYAIELAKKEKSKIILLHTYLINYPVSYTSVDLIMEEKKEALEYSEHQLKAESMKITHAGEIAYEYISEESTPIDAILKVAKERKVDLIIMGTKGESNLANAIFGSNTAAVIEKAPCAVIAVPLEASFKAIKKITYATAYNHSDLFALIKVVEMAKLFGAQVNVLHIIETSKLESEREEKQKMKSFMNDANNSADYNNMSYQLLEGESVEEALEKYLDEDSTGMLVLSTHHRGFFRRLFGTSITKYMAYHSTVPLMAFHTVESPIKVF
jgi:nucleotide-binding universal stress UspA family protein